jgi:broad specificity phosphatase PhoE
MILVRHSLPELDPEVASVRWHLSEEGRARSRVLAEQLRRLAPDAIYASLEPKALETAEILGHAMDLGVTGIEDLREHDRTGVPFLTRPGEFEESVHRLFAAPDECVFGSESASAALARFYSGVGQVLSHCDRRPLVVTHGTVMSLYVAAVSGVDAAAFWRELSMPCWVVLGNDLGGSDLSIEHLPA